MILFKNKTEISRLPSGNKLGFKGIYLMFY